MDKSFEYISFENDFPIRVFVQRVTNYKLHWHNQIEILYVIKGSINVTAGGTTFTLHKDDMIYINGAEIHSTSQTKGENLIIALQITDTKQEFFYNLDKLTFQSELFFQDRDSSILLREKIKNKIVQIIWEYNKRESGYENLILSYMNSILSYLIRSNYLVEQTEKNILPEKGLERLTNILKYLDSHYSEKLSLQTIAEKEHVNYYYLSHFFKSTVGISFKEYLKNYRLNKSLEFLCNSRHSITSIAYDCGFPNIKSYTTAFREKFGMLPSEYRKTNRESQESIASISQQSFDANEDLYYSSINKIEDLSIIFENIPFDMDKPFEEEADSTVINLTVDTIADAPVLTPYWQNLITFARAAECLTEELRSQLRDLAQTVPFKYARFHGIFNDDMMVVNLRQNGQIVYNWLYVDSVLDFLLSINIRPFLELSFMPSAIASGSDSIFWWKGNITPPKNMQLWTDLVSAFFIHCINRYGLSEVSTWYVEVWNEPDYINVFWSGNMNDYFELYHQTATTVRRLCPDIKIGGPAITHIQFKTNPWIREFCRYCQNNAVPLDFVSFHIYSDESNVYLNKGKDIFPTIPRRVFGSQNIATEIIETHTLAATEEFRAPLEFHVTEWNISPKPRFLVRDTAFMAPYIIKTILNNLNRVSSLGTWTLSDAMEEMGAPLSPFHGGLGIINMHGIKKPSFYAYYFLSMLGDEILLQGQDFIVTRSHGSNYQVLCFNYNHFDSAAANGDFSLEDDTHRYRIFMKNKIKSFHFLLENMNGNYKETRLELNRVYGSSYDEWVKLGAPQNMTPDEISYLKSKATPKRTVKYQMAEKTYPLVINVPEFGCAFISLEYQM